LLCGKKSKKGGVRNLFRFFCTQRCAAKWAVQKAEATNDWCDKHGWHQVGFCSSCEPFDFGLEENFEIEEEEEVEEWPEDGWCPKCRNDEHLGLDENHGRAFFYGWHCTSCLEHYWSFDIYDGHYDDFEEKAEKRWQEAWKKLGVNRITVSCAGPKPSYHRVVEEIP
jgi:hypothetical protein